MRSAPVHDFFAKNGKIREDGRMVPEMCLHVVKKPAESGGLWDYYKLVATMPADQAFQTVSESRCALVKNMQSAGSKSRRQLFARVVIARVKTAECRLLAGRGGSRDFERMAAFGAKRTCMGIWASPASVADDPISDIGRHLTRCARRHSRPSSKV